MVGNGTNSVVTRPQRVIFPTDGSITAVTVGDRHACAIVGGATYCWGFNSFGQLGDGTTETRLTPTRIANDPGFADVKATGSTTCGRVAADGRVMCWGYGLDGEIGNGLENNARVPTQVVNPL